MAKFDNLSIEDLREFIGLLTGDTYFPEQLLDFDAITLADAIRYLQENNSTKNSYTPVNANNIYKVSAAIEIDNLHHRLEDIKNYELDDMDISDADRKNIEEFMSHIDTLVNTESSHCMFDVNANGLQDSQISLIDDEITDTYRDAIVVLDEQTNCFSDFQDNVGGYVLSLQEIIDKHLIIETVEDFKKYFEKEGWTVYGSEDENKVSWDIGKPSPLGEDFYFTIDCEATPKAIVMAMNEQINSFDINEHIQLFAESAGRDGVPPLDELIVDAKDIRNMLQELSSNRPVVYGYETSEYNIDKTNDEPDICE